MIPYRPILALIAAVAALFVSARLAYKLEFEGGINGEMNIPPDEEGVVVRSNEQDQLLGLSYVPADRRKNLKAFGLSDPLIDRTMRSIVNYERNSLDRIDALILDAPDLDQVHQAFCGRSNFNRPRYEALKFLVYEKSGRRNVINLDEANGLNYFDWADRAPIAGVYKALELRVEDARKDDATLMGVAAILLKAEDFAIEGDSPWGRGPHKWSWEDVVKKYDGAEELVVMYFAMFHVFAERMYTEDGLCAE